MNKTSLISSIIMTVTLVVCTYGVACGEENPLTHPQTEQIYITKQIITHDMAMKMADDARIDKAAKARESVELAKQKAEEEARIAAEEEAARLNGSKRYSDYPTYYYGGDGVLTKSGGVNYYNNRKETWYSQRVLPGGGLNIPGRHVASDGTIRDADGYICVAASDLPKGSTIETSLGTGKVYDTGCASGVTDIYTNW